MPPVLMVFAKAPLPGRVKTRLVPPLTHVQAASLHEAFVRDTIVQFQTHPHLTLELHTDIETDAWADVEVPRILQHEGDLGLKMLKALEGALQRGAERAAVLGSDAPTLPTGHVEALLGALTDVALGPTDDGGYYAIAARRIHPAMFTSVRWSTTAALQDTIAACRAAGLTTTTGPPWFDIDSVHDLDRLRKSEQIPPYTRRALESLASALASSRGPKSA